MKVKDLSYFNIKTKKFKIENRIYKIIIKQDAITSNLEGIIKIEDLPDT